MELTEREQDAGSKPSAAFAEDELAIAVLGGDSVEVWWCNGGVGRWRCFPSLATPPHLDRLGFRECRWGVWRLR